MFKKIKRALLWTRALHHSRLGNVGSAQTCLDKMKSISPLSHFESAFEATLLLREHQFEASKEIFLNVIDMNWDSDSPNKIYTRFYALSLVHSMHGNKIDEANAREAALQVPCDRVLRTWLPL